MYLKLNHKVQVLKILTLLKFGVVRKLYDVYVFLLDQKLLLVTMFIDLNVSFYFFFLRILSYCNIFIP